MYKHTNKKPSIKLSCQNLPAKTKPAAKHNFSYTTQRIAEMFYFETISELQRNKTNQ